MRTLELGYNPIGAKGAEALAETVKFHSKLTTLRMGWCKITKDGAYYLAVRVESERTSPPRPRLPPFARAYSFDFARLGRKGGGGGGGGF